MCNQSVLTVVVRLGSCCSFSLVGSVYSLIDIVVRHRILELGFHQHTQHPPLDDLLTEE